jgi:protoporphyrinogen oxidase
VRRLPCGLPIRRRERRGTRLEPKAGDSELRVVILGAGPAGLTAAYELTSLGIPCVVLERDAVVGGLARTVEHNGFRFDIGGHRFYTKVKLIRQIWSEVLGEDLLTRTRLSRIYYKSRFFRYPLEPLDAFRGLGVLESARCGLSYARSRAFPRLPENDFATWVSNRFGQRLYEIFFRSYTEKVWGMDCHQIAAEWAAQRIQGLSVGSLLRNALLPWGREEPKTLIKQFQYPRLGPGMLWTRMREIVERRGAEVVMNAPVEKIGWRDGRVLSVRAGSREYQPSHVISSIPIRELTEKLDPAAPQELRAAGEALKYRDFLTVALVAKTKNSFPDNWIYLHDPEVLAGRVQNYKNWSEEMSPDPEMTCLGVEYFCNEGDSIWARSNEELAELATGEMARLGLLRAEDVAEARVVRMPKAYPVYDHGYQKSLALIRGFLARTPNLQSVGRNGMHRYNNQDHSMLTGILAARNICGAHFDLWAVNVDKDYLEEDRAITNDELAALEQSQPLVPRTI